MQVKKKQTNKQSNKRKKISKQKTDIEKETKIKERKVVGNWRNDIICDFSVPDGEPSIASKTSCFTTTIRLTPRGLIDYQ